MTDNQPVFKRAARMLGLDLDAWNRVVVASLGLAALAAAVVGIATFAVIRLQDAEAIAAKAEFDRYRLESGQRISEAEARAAEANQRAQEEQLARLKIEERLAPRSINSDQLAAIKAAVMPGVKVIIQPFMPHEPTDFADILAAALTAAGAKVTPFRPGNMVMSGQEGLHVSWNHRDTTESSIFLALEKAGLNPIDDADPPGDKAVRIWVAPKPAFARSTSNRDPWGGAN